MTWYEQTADPRAVLHAAGMRWRLGRSWATSRPDIAPWFPVIATTHKDTDDVVRRFELGAGSIVTARAIADDTAIGMVVRRPGPNLALSRGDEFEGC